MNKLALILGLCISATSIANMNVIETPINGTALKGPNKLFQILDPTMTLYPNAANSDYREIRLAADSKTARAACGILGKYYVDFKSAKTERGQYVLLVSFSDEGVLNQHPYFTDVEFIKLLVCKERDI